ncbi:hypothetical protein LUZ60_016475 [Juncus effusus]|nr:hypothetical protein LUZ60_016475 [Juncus effusus]
MTIFGIEQLEKATGKFDQTLIVGCGGHGIIYKGILSDQRIVAVKKPKIKDDREIEEFLNEVVILSQLNHKNVVKLFGCCLESEVPLLVYEFISNGTLTKHLHVEDGQSLSWNDRLRIVLETARALSYLHSAASISIFHRDIKTSNILLNDGLISKLSDFGASRSIPDDGETATNTAIQGTLGYLDPEYYQTGRLTTKSDVYSFGIILLEMLSRRKPISNIPNGMSLVEYFSSAIRESCMLEILDPQIVEEEYIAELESVAMLAQKCVRSNGQERPTMKEVEMRLEILWASKRRSAYNWNRDQHLEQQRSLLENQQIEGDTSGAYSSEQNSMLSSFPR